MWEEGLPAPERVNSPGRFVAAPRGLDFYPADPTPPAAEVLEEFAERGLLVWRDTFASV